MSYLLDSYLAQHFIALDPDATAFSVASGITDAHIKAALSDLVSALKDAGIWGKLDAVYPFVGGTASTHKYNLRNPLDTDGAFRLTFHGAWTHSANGVLPDGSTGYADTHYSITTNGADESTSLAVYARTNGTAGKMFGVYGGTTGRVDFSNTGNFAQSSMYDISGTNSAQASVSDDKGFTLGSRTRTGGHTPLPISTLYQNGSILATNGTTPTGFSDLTAPLYLAASDFEGVAPFSFNDQQYAFAAIGRGLTDGEASAFYTAVQAFETALGRQV